MESSVLQNFYIQRMSNQTLVLNLSHPGVPGFQTKGDETKALQKQSRI